MSSKRLWLTPVHIGNQEQHVTLQADRFELLPLEAGDRFLALVRSVHPRMLVPFKSNLLLSEEAELACGVDELPFELTGGKPIEFNGERLELSHCAQAYMKRLAVGREMKEWLAEAYDRLSSWAEPERHPMDHWLIAMQLWLDRGDLIILLREE